MSNKSRDAETIVREFCRAWDRKDLEGILGMLSPDIEYQNVPRPPMHGRDSVRAFLTPIVKDTTRIEFIVTAMATTEDGAVLTERIDKLHYGDKLVDIPIMGIFKLHDGLITVWRDYADSSHVQAQFAQIKSWPTVKSG